MSEADTPLPIALVTTELRPGGAERNMVALAKGLVSRGFAPRVYSLAPSPPPGQDQLAQLLSQAMISVDFIGVQRSHQFFSAVRRLRRLLADHPPRLIQSFLFHANVVSAVAARGMSIPVVAGLRVAQRERIRGFVERRLTRHIDAFVCVSQGVADVAEQHAGLPRDKLHVIPNGIDAHRFANITPADLSQFGIAAGQKVVLSIGRLDRQKGVDVLLDAARQFLPQRSDVTLLIVGDGPERANLQRQVETSSLAKQVIFAPWRADSLSLLAAADVVAIPSRWEGMSNVLLEAAALARLIVVSDVEGTRDVLSSQVHDWIVPSEDSAALAAKIAQLIEADATAIQLAAANQQHVLNTFRLDKTISAYTELYRSLISSGK